MFAVLAGGGKVGYDLAKALVETGHEIVLIEKSPQKAKIIADELGEIVFEGDACEMMTLHQVGMNRADVAVAVTGEDEDNLVFCQLAKEVFKVKKSIARVNNTKNEKIFKALGIDHVINATSIIFHLIEEGMEAVPIISLFPLLEGGVELVEVRLNQASRVVGKTIKELKVEQDFVFIAVIRNHQIFFPKGSTRFQAGDVVFALTHPGKEALLKKVLL